MRIANRMDKPEGSGMDLVMTPSAESDARNTTAENSQGSASSGVEELMAYGAPSSSETSRGRKRKLTPTTPDTPMELTLEMRTSSTASIKAELIRRIEEIMKVTTTSSNLKNTYIKTLEEAASIIAAGTLELTRKTGPAYSTGAARMAEMRVEVLEKEIEGLQKEQSGKARCVRQEKARCHASTLELGHPKEDDEVGGEKGRLFALEKKFEELRPSLMRPWKNAYRTGVIVRK